MNENLMTIRSSLGLVCLLLAAQVLIAQNPGGISVGLTPLTELKTDFYKGYQGGLYPQGANAAPPAHDSAGRSIARHIVPLNAAGQPDPAFGKIVLLSIGMSNTTQEFSAFKPLADADAAKNPRLVLVDGAQGGQTASIISNPAATFWTVIDQRLQAAGVTRQQVQVAWVKEADAGPTSGFPKYAQILSSELELIVRVLKSLYPNIRIAYFSSRIYAGYATSTLNPEPYAYESGFSVKWLIEKQISGDTSLAYAGPVPRSPWLAWGPYLWADGLTPRTDGLVWQAADFQTDGTHPSPIGQQKVASLLHTFFSTDPTSAPWFLKGGVTEVHSDLNVPQKKAVLAQSFPNPVVLSSDRSTTLSFQLPGSSHVTIKVYDQLGREVAHLLNDIRPAGDHFVRWDPSGMSTGIYYYTLRVVGPGTMSGSGSSTGVTQTETKRLVLYR